MAASLAVGAAPEVTSNVLGVASGAFVLVAITMFGLRRYGARDPFAWLPALALAASHSFVAWSTSGLETMFFTALCTGAWIAYLRERELERQPIVGSVLFALASLTRPEGALFMFVAGLGFFFDVVRRKRSLKQLVLWCAPYLVLVGGHLLWRHSYYGYWLPNTFYAKVVDTWWDQGVRYFELFVRFYPVVPFLPLLLVALLRGDFATRLFIVALALYCGYVLSVGGDRFEFRFLVVVLPIFYLSIAHGLRGVAAVGESVRFLRWPALGAAVAAGAALVVLCHRSADVEVPREDRAKIVRLQAIATYAENRAEQGKFLRELIDAGELSPDIVLCVGGAGALPYYTGWTTIDRRGLNDETIAHQPYQTEKRGRLGHERDATWEYLEERGVAVFDFKNQLLYDDDAYRRRIFKFRKKYVRLRGVQLRDRYMFFATFVPDEELETLLEGYEIIRGRQP